MTTSLYPDPAGAAGTSTLIRSVSRPPGAIGPMAGKSMLKPPVVALVVDAGSVDTIVVPAGAVRTSLTLTLVSVQVPLLPTAIV